MGRAVVLRRARSQTRGGEAQVARDLFDWTVARGWRPTFGTGKHDGSWVPVVEALGREHYPIALYTNGWIEIQFQHLEPRPRSTTKRSARTASSRQRDPWCLIRAREITKRPNIPPSLLAADPAALDQLKRVIEWIEAEASSAT